MKKQTRNTIILIVLLLLLAGVGLLLRNYFLSPKAIGKLSGETTQVSEEGTKEPEEETVEEVTEEVEDSGIYAIIQYRGEIYKKLDLYVDTELLVGDPDGDYNIVKVEDGTVYVSEGNCADLICVNTYPINEYGGVIACLPHSLIIYVDDTTQ